MIINVDDHCSITLDLSITLLESSIILLENIIITGVTHDDLNMTIVICLKYSHIILS
jgi:hypothetical protein